MLAKDKEAKGAPTAAPPPALASEGGSVYAARARSTTRDVAAYIVSVITPLLFSSAPGHVISRWRSGKRRSTEPRRRLEAPPEKHRHNDFGRCRCEQRQTGGAASCSSASMADWCCPRAAPKREDTPSVAASNSTRLSASWRACRQGCATEVAWSLSQPFSAGTGAASRCQRPLNLTLPLSLEKQATNCAAAETRFRCCSPNLRESTHTGLRDSAHDPPFPHQRQV